MLYFFTFLASCLSGAPMTNPIDSQQNWSLHGHEIHDPYLWLEEEGHPDRQGWLDKQDATAGQYFDALDDIEDIRNKLLVNTQYERFGVPVQKGERLFFTRQSVEQSQPALYMREKNGDDRLLIDPTAADSSGNTSLAGFSVSSDGKTLSYAYSDAGTDWCTFRFMDVDSGKEMADRLEHIKFCMPTWAPNGKEVIYWRFDAPNTTDDFAAELSVPTLYRHILGTPQSSDQMLYRPDDKRVAMGFLNEPHISEDERFLFFYTAIGCDMRTAIHVCDLQNPDAKVKTILPLETAIAAIFGEKDGQLLIWTDLDAPNGRVVITDVNDPIPANWKVLIPEGDAILQDAAIVGDQIALAYLKDASAELQLFTLAGKKLRNIDLPGHGTVVRSFHGIGLNANPKGTTLYFAYSDFLQPTCIMEYDADQASCRTLFKPDCPWRPDDYVTTQNFCSSADGERIPYYLVHKKDLKKDNVTPTLLYGYGGFGIPITPNFNAGQFSWVQEGGILAVANLRGGGEYGERWHRDGRLDKKQNVFNDCYAVAQSLIDNGYTSPQYLAVHGRSNGGLLAGASLVQRPDLFGAAVVSVGVLDMLRFHKFTIGHAWISDYGSPEDPKDFENLLSYSPYHNVKAGTEYPATLITTADHDDRVVPLHSYKFAGALQDAHAGEKPVILRVYKQTGHGSGKSRQQEIAEDAEVISFLKKELS